MTSGPSRGDVPFTVIGGYLGAGKTSLLNQLISDPDSPRLAIIVNDFGALNIDERLIRSRDGGTLSLTNGCVCCSLSDALADGLHTLLDRVPPPEHIVLEASGVAEPRRVAQYGLLTQGVRLAAVICVADVETIETQAQDKFVGPLVQSQLKDADLIVLSKTDLVSSDRGQEVRSWVETLVPAARIIDTRGQRLPTEVLLGEGASSSLEAQTDDPVPRFFSFSYSSSDLYDREKIENTVRGLPRHIVRAKGFVHTSDGPLVLHLAGRRVTLEAVDVENQATRDTRLVFISAGVEIDEDALHKALKACRP